MNIFDEFETKLKNALNQLNIENNNNEELNSSRIVVEVPRDQKHGDLATNAALILSQTFNQNPRQLAERIKDFFKDDPTIASIHVAGPGFINFCFKQDYWHNVLEQITFLKEDYGKSVMGNGHKVNVEYVSANPTGPLHVGHCRGAIVGDVLANLLKFAGYDVLKEYYINDAGGQIDVLGRSVFMRYCEALGHPIHLQEGFYPGEYLIPLGQDLAKQYKDKYLNCEEEALPVFKKYAIDAMMDLIREDLAKLKIKHDVFFSERSLHADGQKAIKAAIEDLKAKNYIYNGTLPPPKGQENEDWEDREQVLFRTTQAGDDQDRALVKSDGSFTYFSADIAYFYDKYKRGFKEMVYVLGADHSGYVKRLEAMAYAVSEGKARLTAMLCQLVKLYRDNIPVKMSKRAGSFITLREVVDEVGSDPIRFMMLFRKSDAPLDFDFVKVTEQTKENPVFYVQYAFARTHSILRQAVDIHGKDILNAQDVKCCFSLLKDESELNLIKKLADYPRLIESAVYNREPHRLAFYLYDLASAFHAQWNKGNENKDLRFVIQENKDLTLARLALVKAVSNVIKSGLQIMGIEAPEHME